MLKIQATGRYALRCYNLVAVKNHTKHYDDRQKEEMDVT